MRLSAGVTLTVLASAAWGALCFATDMPPQLGALFGTPIGFAAMVTGILWQNR